MCGNVDRHAIQTGICELKISTVDDIEAVFVLLSKSGSRNVPNLGSHLGHQYSTHTRLGHQYSTLKKLDSGPAALQINLSSPFFLVT